jgi:hypothetical protein
MLKTVLSPISRTEKRIEDSIKTNRLETGYENVRDMEVTYCRVYWPNLVSAVFKLSGEIVGNCGHLRREEFCVCLLFLVLVTTTRIACHLACQTEYSVFCENRRGIDMKIYYESVVNLAKYPRSS